jgi:hypothetical protein
MAPIDLAQTIAEAYRWQRRLGNVQIAAPHCHIVADPAHPDVWDSNHADEVTAQSDAEMDGVFRAMDNHLAHTPWRVVHTDRFTPDAFLARLALDDFQERPATIQMALHGDVKGRGAALPLHPVASDADWDKLLRLVLADHAEGRRTSGLEVSPEVSAGMVAAFADHLRKADCHTIFLGALVGEEPKRLYARLGFRPVMLARSWIKEMPDKDHGG